MFSKPQDHEICVKVWREETAGFFLLDDGSDTPELNIAINFIKEHGYCPLVLNLNEIGKELGLYLRSQIPFLPLFDLWVGLGEGGGRTLETVVDQRGFAGSCIPEKRAVRWERRWEDGHPAGFVHDLDSYDWKGKKLLIFEDVVASGETLFAAKQEFFLRGVTAMAATTACILEYSPLTTFSPFSLFAGILARNDVTMGLVQDRDPHWFPPFFSTRHLFFGDNEMDHFHDILALRYFNGEPEFAKMINTAKQAWKER